eukprot:m.65755 g.65755  ORF g.65755 m.65755 type:complete len:376 (+) comp14005_c0_seq4:188-1315(+)
MGGCRKAKSHRRLFEEEDVSMKETAELTWHERSGRTHMAHHVLFLLCWAEAVQNGLCALPDRITRLLVRAGDVCCVAVLIDHLEAASGVGGVLQQRGAHVLGTVCDRAAEDLDAADEHAQCKRHLCAPVGAHKAGGGVDEGDLLIPCLPAEGVKAQVVVEASGVGGVLQGVGCLQLRVCLVAGIRAVHAAAEHREDSRGLAFAQQRQQRVGESHAAVVVQRQLHIDALAGLCAALGCGDALRHDKDVQRIVAGGKRLAKRIRVCEQRCVALLELVPRAAQRRHVLDEVRAHGSVAAHGGHGEAGLRQAQSNPFADAGGCTDDHGAPASKGGRSSSRHIGLTHRAHTGRHGGEDEPAKARDSNERHGKGQPPSAAS